MEQFTYKKRLGIINLHKTERPIQFPGIFVEGKYWGTKSGIIHCVPDQLEGDWNLDDLPLKGLPIGVSVAMGAYGEMILLKSS